ncbi:MAG: DUF1385 domain-containing protein [Bacteriovoracaceae bacterium]|nr:DUF1385 domain-containing protein [Bacteriovoracaceae bacterium]
MWRSLRPTPTGIEQQYPGLVSGLAINDGVLTRSPKSFVLAKRTDEGTIKLVKSVSKPFQLKNSIHSIAVLRGIIYLLDTAKSYISLAELERVKSTHFKSFTILGLLALAIVVFGVLPHLLLIELPFLIGLSWAIDGIGLHLSEMCLKLGLFLGYLKIIKRFPDVHSLLKYNTAKNMAFMTANNDEDTAIECDLSSSSFNPWCELTFLTMSFMATVVVSTPLFGIIGLGESFPFGLKEVYIVMWKLIFMFSIAGVLFELVFFSMKAPNRRISSLITGTHKKIQNLISIRPDKEEVEVALCSLSTLKALDKKNNLNTVSDDAKVEVEITGLSDIVTRQKAWKEFLEQ